MEKSSLKPDALTIVAKKHVNDAQEAILIKDIKSVPTSRIKNMRLLLTNLNVASKVFALKSRGSQDW